MNDLLKTLNTDFGLAGELEFVSGPGGFIIVKVSNDLATAEIALHGGQVLRFQPRGEEQVLWVSPDSEYRPQRAIRGGIPLCWPWFGPHPIHPEYPKHGFARLESWQVLGVERLAGGETRLRLVLPQINEIHEWWRHPFELSILITVGRELDIKLVAANPGPEAFRMTGALHSYFYVQDVEAITIEGLRGRIYLDQPAGGIPKIQRENVILKGEVDRVYLDTAADCTIVDPGLGRRIHVKKLGSHSTVVWNPGEALVQSIRDFTTSEWRRVVCVETSNTASDSIEIAPGCEHILGTTIGVQKL